MAVNPEFSYVIVETMERGREISSSGMRIEEKSRRNHVGSTITRKEQHRKSLFWRFLALNAVCLLQATDRIQIRFKLYSR